ncbi:MAG: hypothetical protein J6E38_01445 [Clostridia bacterium]|nr:hypothetical protein [Clostridia bacterium]
MASGDLYNRNNQKVGSVDIDIEGAVNKYHEQKNKADIAELNRQEDVMKIWSKMLNSSTVSEKERLPRIIVQEIKKKYSINSFYGKLNESDKKLYKKLKEYKFKNKFQKSQKEKYKKLYLGLLYLTIALCCFYPPFVWTGTALLTPDLKINPAMYGKLIVCGTCAIASVVFEILYKLPTKTNKKKQAKFNEEHSKLMRERMDFTDKVLYLFDVKKIEEELKNATDDVLEHKNLTIHAPNAKEIIFHAMWND